MLWGERKIKLLHRHIINIWVIKPERICVERCHDARTNILYPVFIASIFTSVCPSVHSVTWTSRNSWDTWEASLAQMYFPGGQTLAALQWYLIDDLLWNFHYSLWTFDTYLEWLNVAVMDQHNIVLPLHMILKFK